MKTIILTFLLMMFSVVVMRAQSFTAGMNIGMGSYSMESMKQMQDFRLEFSMLPGRVTDDFPVHWTSGFEVGLCFPRFPSRLIWFYQYASTGARVSSMDYSGEMELDVVANCNQYGVGIEQDVLKRKFFSLSLAGKFSYLASSVKTTDYLRIYNQGQREEYRFTSAGAGLEPGIIAGFNILFFRIGLYGGYLFSFSERLHLPGERKAYIELPTGDDVRAEWNGWRAGLKLDVRIPLKKKAVK
jgi:hypothetical protein